MQVAILNKLIKISIYHQLFWWSHHIIKQLTIFTTHVFISLHNKRPIMLYLSRAKTERSDFFPLLSTQNCWYISMSLQNQPLYPSSAFAQISSIYTRTKALLIYTSNSQLIIRRVTNFQSHGNEENVFGRYTYTSHICWHELALQGRLRWWYEQFHLRFLQTGCCYRFISPSRCVSRMVSINIMYYIIT